VGRGFGAGRYRREVVTKVTPHMGRKRNPKKTTEARKEGLVKIKSAVKRKGFKTPESLATKKFTRRKNQNPPKKGRGKHSY